MTLIYFKYSGNWPLLKFMVWDSWSASVIMEAQFFSTYFSILTGILSYPIEFVHFKSKLSFSVSLSETVAIEN